MFRRKNKRSRMGNGSDWPTKAYRGAKLRRHKRQRAKQGYSEYDWWSFDTYITWVIGNAVLDFKNRGVGLHYGSSSAENDEWLDSIAKPLLRYSESKFDIHDHEEELRMYNEAREAMKKFSEHLGTWWD